MTSSACKMDEGVVLQAYRRVGRSLQAARDFCVGEVVLQDEPALQWSAETVSWSGCARGVDTGDLLRARGRGDTAPLNVPTFFLAAAAAFCADTTSEAARATVLDMHVPDLPLLGSLLDVTLVCERLAQCLDPPQMFSSSVLLHAMLAAKVNAHRGPDHSWRLYPRGSKLAHSCAPNCAYQPHTHSFVAIQRIPSGGLVSFSYIGGPMLLLPADLRQERLLASHLFLCQCPRCRGEDVARRFSCPRCGAKGCVTRCTSGLIDSDHDLFPALPWRCSACPATFRDADDAVMAMVANETRLWSALRDVGEPGHPYRLPTLHKLLNDVATVMGRDHWMYAVCAGHVARYFSQLGRATRDMGLLGLGTQWQSVLVHLQSRILCESAVQPTAACSSHMVVAGTLTSAAEQMRMLQSVSDGGGASDQRTGQSAAALVASAQREDALKMLRLGPAASASGALLLGVANAMRSGLADRAHMEGRRVDQLAALLDELSALPSVSTEATTIAIEGIGASSDGDVWDAVFAGLEGRVSEVHAKFTQAANETT